ncbi:sensor domain-containing diguanylate cyclase [Clostridium sp. E02]|uniref:sensor domain-containing diguanylate cyclase n=1 Tax=Clostridium sp. E02 TaxID=2487134 RepID=UPI000F526E38|nr:sensor domain-containing diguanylate cyclase [Clostridium sp. E02]
MKYHKNLVHHPPKVMILTGLFVSVILGMCILNVYFFKEVEKSLFKQTFQDIKQENDKSMTFLSTTIQAKKEWLQLFTTYCVLPDGSGEESWWGVLEDYDNTDSRFLVADADGIAYYGDHHKKDISSQLYFEKAMLGNANLSGVLKREFNGQDGIVLAVPIIRENQVKGAAILEFSTDKLRQYINDSEFSRYGTNLIFTKNGNMLVTCGIFGDYGNLYDILKTMEFREGSSVEKMKIDLEEGKTGYISYYNDGRKRLLYYQSIGIEDWFLASIVETEGYESTFYRIRHLTASFITGSTILLVCGGLLILGIFHLRKREVKRSQKDYLTGVYTRETARKLVEPRLKVGGKKRFYACMFLDIDDFKKINDTFGHDEGDQVLVHVGQILSACTRDEDVIVRFGGDEFLIWLYGIRGRKQPENIAQRILNAFDLSGKIHASIGITAVQADVTDYDEILKRADQALYQAKRKGKNQYSVQN